MHQTSSQFVAPDAAAFIVNSPLTVALFYILVGYYVCYFSVVLWKSKHLTAEELAVEPAPLSAVTGRVGVLRD
jgi:hypothetical protein